MEGAGGEGEGWCVVGAGVEVLADRGRGCWWGRGRRCQREVPGVQVDVRELARVLRRRRRRLRGRLRTRAGGVLADRVAAGVITAEAVRRHGVGARGPHERGEGGGFEGPLPDAGHMLEVCD